MLKITNKEMCCGCEACRSICPEKAIIMQPDNEGFLYPIVDMERCCRCGLCNDVCPNLNPIPEVCSSQRGFLMQHKDARILRQSTSGGAFTAIAETVIGKGGVVFGAAFDTSNRVCHCAAYTLADLEKFRNSKYVQSHIGDSFLLARNYLEAGRAVCFSGTPCQIEGFLRFLGKPYPVLVTVDVVCRSVPSPRLLSLYLCWQQKRHRSTIDKIVFRDKYGGYQYSQLTLLNSKAKRIYHAGIDSDEYLRAFFGNMASRPSCYACAFKKRYRQSDITLWDCLDARAYGVPWDDDKGTTRVLVHSKQGNALLKEISPDRVRIKEADADALTAGVREMVQPIARPEKRERFMKDLAEHTPDDIFRRYFPKNIRTFSEKILRVLLKKTRLYRPVRRLKLSLQRRAEDDTRRTSI